MTPKPKDDEIVDLKILFMAALQFPTHRMVDETLKKYEIYMHQLTPKAIVRLRVFVWVVRSQGA
jgi:hypothetical protein